MGCGANSIPSVWGRCQPSIVSNFVSGVSRNQQKLGFRCADNTSSLNWLDGRSPLSTESWHVANSQRLLPLVGCWSLHHLLSMEPWAEAKKSFKLVGLCHKLLSGFLANCHVSRLCQLMVRVIGGCVQISWHLPHSWGKLRKPSARSPSMKAVRSVIASNGIPYLQMRSAGLHRTSGRKMEENKERTGIALNNCIILHFIFEPYTLVSSFRTVHSSILEITRRTI